MPFFVVVILGEHLRSMENRLTTAGLCLTALISSGNIIAISISSGLHPSRPSNTFTSTSTKAMIALPWSFARVGMRSGSTWMLATLLSVRPSGVPWPMRCTTFSQLPIVWTYIFPECKMCKMGYLFILNISIINFTLKYIILTTCKTGGAGIGGKSCGGKCGKGYSQKHHYYYKKAI